jgi:acyl-coenzyme A thioesterase PaaI-like protein
VPRFYFNLRNDLSVDDEEGMELPDVQAARALAAKYALDMVAASVLEQGRINLSHRIEVTDDSGGDIVAVAFGDVVTIES